MRSVGWSSTRSSRATTSRQITFTCDPRRPAVELPAVGDRIRWEFMQLRGESEDELKSEDKIRALVKRKAGIERFRDRAEGRLHFSCPRRRPMAARTACSSPATPRI